MDISKEVLVAILLVSYISLWLVGVMFATKEIIRSSRELKKLHKTKDLKKKSEKEKKSTKNS